MVEIEFDDKDKTHTGKEKKTIDNELLDWEEDNDKINPKEED